MKYLALAAYLTIGGIVGAPAGRMAYEKFIAGPKTFCIDMNGDGIKDLVVESRDGLELWLACPNGSLEEATAREAAGVKLLITQNYIFDLNGHVAKRNGKWSHHSVRL